ncbi:MAG: hypothetical protein A2V79_00390 [Betaproteobacteria bacterium RBG_16_56_24]|nr:MAG: hypothetical protein A2V79_00390 [Betaproteobacteria bacterium RBG_16_56_24]
MGVLLKPNKRSGSGRASGMPPHITGTSTIHRQGAQKELEQPDKTQVKVDRTMQNLYHVHLFIP